MTGPFARLPLLPILAILFFCSGACALIYQVLWLRTLGWVFGVTVYAASTVWATFMAGLAVGSLGSRTQLPVVLIVFALSGAISLGLEVVWFRVLTLFLRPTVYGFAVMLATVLAGIALGSYLVTPLLDRRLRWIAVLATLELAIGIVVAFSFAPLTYLNPLSRSLTPVLSRVMPEYLVYPISGSLLAIFPTALLMGIAFPIGLRVWAGGRSRAGGTAERIGRFYALNVSGAIVGSLLTGFLLLPRLGSRGSLILLAALSLGSGLVLLWVSELRPRTRFIVSAGAAAIFAGVVWLSPDPFTHFVALRYPNQDIVWREESVETTVVVHENRQGQRSLTVNGNHEASTGGGMTFVHRRIGHLPMAVHPNAQTALVIGLGGGATAGAVSVHTGVQVDIVELSGAVVKGAGFFGSINYQVLTRPNVRLRVDDGRNYLMLTPRRYDVVTADVIIPIFAGSGNLYSREYFALMRRALNRGGLVVQWVAGTEAEYKTIARTFLSVFPQTTVWGDGTLLLGSVEPLQIRRSDFERKVQLPGRAEGLRDLGFDSFETLKKSFVAGPAELAAFVGDGEVLSDDRPLAEYFLSLPRDRQPDLASMHGDVNRYIVEE